MDEELVEQHVPTVGERLKAAREEKGLNLEDIAAQTRIPLRHLESIEVADWDKLPAPTYTTGFAKSYATAVGLDRTEIGEQLREEMGGQRFASTPEVFEPADPARTMPKWLVLGAILAVILLVVLMSWLNRRALNSPEEATANAPAAVDTAPAQAPAPAQPAPTAQGPVVLAATQPVWLKVSDGAATLYSGILQSGQTYAVPANAAAPMLTTAKAEALRITVGSAVAPAVGPPATKISDVSLRAGDLLKGPPAAASVPQAPGRSEQSSAASPPRSAEPVQPTTNTRM